MDNWELYRIFYHVAKTEKISAAAQLLCVSQPAVSQAIKVLEEQLRCDLFVRSTKGVHLTAEGAVLYEYIQRAFENITQGEKLIANMCNLEQGEICIGASDMTLQFYLLPYLERFHLQYPDINIRVTNAPTPATLTALEQGKIDFGVISTPLEEEERLLVWKVERIRDVFVAGTRFLELKNRTVTLKHLEQYPLICLEKQTSARKFWEHYFEENGLSLEPEFELATSDMIVQFALRNMGIGIVMKGFAEPYLEKGQLFEIMFDKKPPEREICIVTKRNHVMSAASKRFLETLQEEEQGYKKDGTNVRKIE